MTTFMPKFDGNLMEVGAAYDTLPWRERTLLKHYKTYPFKIANDRGREHEWFIYDYAGAPVAVVIYHRDRKLCVWSIHQR